MLFHSIDYLLFLPSIALIFHIIPNRYRWGLLLPASYAFYAAWRVEFTVLLMFSTVADYFIGRSLYKTQTRWKRKALLYCSIAVNLGLLGYFKYLAFGWSLLGPAAADIGLITSYTPLHIILPIGISFYTFQTLSYSIDIYRKRSKPEFHFGYFACYVTFFPQLLAGPIERASRLLPQLRNPAPLTTAMFHSAIGLLLIGYFKKLVIADRLDLFTNQISATPEVYSPFQVLAAPIITMYQYYCDFSGYADLAIGSALLMGITLSPNFNRPLAARSMSQMWFSWHITATVWFRDYLLVPLAGNRGRSVRRHACAVMLTGILIGLWHGASVGWLLVGCVIGILAVSEMINKKYFRKYRQPIQSPLGKALYGILAHFYVLFSFMFIIGTFITYDSSIQLQAALSNMAAFQFADMNLSSFIRGLTLFTKYDLVIIIVAIVGLEIWQWKYKTPHITQENTSFKGTHYGGYLLLICCILLFGVQSRPDFIYFQF